MSIAWSWARCFASGDQLRASTQLVEAPEGTVLTSHTVQASLGDLFQMQDDIARRVVEGLALPLTGEPRTSQSSPDVPHNPRAYKLYLKANELARIYNGMPAARALYEQCLELDPTFAPAWAHLGRCHRIIGKYIDPTPDSDSRAEDAFIRAIALNPRLSIAHKFYANLEADTGRAVEAMVRLLTEATRHGNDAELFAGLVHACRYAGLFDESIAAHAEARRLDPTIATSIRQTLLLNRDLERLIGIEYAESVPGGGAGIQVIGLGLAGRVDEARALLARMGQAAPTHPFEKWRLQHLAAWLDRRVEDMIAGLASVAGSKIFDDPEIVFQQGFFFCDLGEHARGLPYLQETIARGFFPVVTLTTWPQFDALRDDPAFRTVLAEAEAGRQRAQDAFREAGGERLLAR